MPDHRLTALTPLGAATPQTERIGTITIAEDAGRAIASLACRLGREDEVTARARDALGIALPGPGRSAAAEPYVVVWTGPGQYFVEAPFATHEDIARILRADFGSAASITEQTDGWARFEVAGERATAMFERLCPVDLARLAPGDVARTTIEHIGVFLACREPGRAYGVTGPRSSAGSLHHALAAAAASVA